MSATNFIAPKGGYNAVSFEYLAPITPSNDIEIRKGAALAAMFVFDMTNGAAKVDKVNELTAAAGVTVDSFLIKDGGARILNNVTLKARNAANSADVDLLKLSASDVFTALPDLTFSEIGKGVNVAVDTALAAAGSDQAGATAISYRFSKVASGTGGVRLPATIVPGSFFVITNRTGVTINLYPGTGHTINVLSANAPATISNGTATVVWGVDSTSWEFLSQT